MFYYIFDKINATLLSIRDSFNKHKNANGIWLYVNGITSKILNRVGIWLYTHRSRLLGLEG